MNQVIEIYEDDENHDDSSFIYDDHNYDFADADWLI